MKLKVISFFFIVLSLLFYLVDPFSIQKKYKKVFDVLEQDLKTKNVTDTSDCLKEQLRLWNIYKSTNL